MKCLFSKDITKLSSFKWQFNLRFAATEAIGAFFLHMFISWRVALSVEFAYFTLEEQASFYSKILFPFAVHTEAHVKY